MKNSAKYEKRVKKLFAGAAKAAAPPEEDLVRLMLLAILEEDTTARKAASAMAALSEEFVDFNELRVSPVKDIAECLGKGFPGVHAKAAAITGALNAAFKCTDALSPEFLAPETKREIRKALRKRFFLSPYAESVLTLCGFDGHAVPVDSLLLEALKLDDCIHPDSDIADLQGFLERIIRNKDAVGCHQALRRYAAKAVSRVAKELARREKLAEAEAAAKAKVEAAAAAKAKARETAKAKAKREAAKKAKKTKKTRKAKKPKKRTKRSKTPRAAKTSKKSTGRRKTASKSRQK